MSAQVISTLVKRYEGELDVVIQNTQFYAQYHKIISTDPYIIKYSDILAKLGMGNPREISSFKQTLKSDLGILQREATRTLCGFNDPLANNIIIGGIQGRYSYKSLDLLIDLCEIEELNT